MEELIKRNFFFNRYDEEEEGEELKEFQNPEAPEGDDDDLYPSDDNEFYSAEEEF